MMDHQGLAGNNVTKQNQMMVVWVASALALAFLVFKAGGFSSIVIEEGTFPGGDFLYKQARREYVTSKDLEFYVAHVDAGLEATDLVDRAYSVFLDPDAFFGRNQRFAAGLLLTPDQEDDPKLKEHLLSTNTGKVPPSEEEVSSLGIYELWPKLLYQSVTLPSAKVATVQFVHTGGYISTFVFSMRILPVLRQYAKTHNSGGPVTVLSTCSSTQRFCKYFAPLEQGELFLLGNVDSDTYSQQLGPLKFTDLRFWKNWWDKLVSGGGGTEDKKASEAQSTEVKVTASEHEEEAPQQTTHEDESESVEETHPDSSVGEEEEEERTLDTHAGETEPADHSSREGGESDASRESSETEFSEDEHEQTHTEEDHTEEAHAEGEHTEEAHAEEVHAEEAHAEQEHTEEAHYKEVHAEEAHYKEVHAEEAHPEEEHAEEAHYEGEHAEEAHPEEVHAEEVHAVEEDTDHAHVEEPESSSDEGAEEAESEEREEGHEETKEEL